MKLGSASVINCIGVGRCAGTQGAHGFVQGAALGRDVQQMGQHLGTGHTVDDGVVHLGDQPDFAARQPLDNVHLPGGLRGNEGSSHHLGDLRVELVLAAGGREGGPIQVVRQVEVGVVHPARVVETQWHGHKPAPEWWQARNSRLEQVGDPLEGVATVGRRRVEDAGVRNLHRGLRSVGVDEHRVDAGHSLHVRLHLVHVLSDSNRRPKGRIVPCSLVP